VRKFFWRLVGSVALVIFLIWRLRADGDRVLAAFAGLDIRFFVAAFFLHVATQIVSAWRWRMFAVAVKLGGSIRSYFSYYFVGMFFNLVLPTSVGGDVVRAWYLAHHGGNGHGRRMPAFLSVLADRISGVIVLALVACTAALFCPVALPGTIVACVAGVGAGAIAGVIGLPILNRYLQARESLSTHLERLRRIAAGGMDYYRNVPLTVKTTLLSIFVQVNSVLVMALIGEGLGLQVPLGYYGIVMPLVSLLTLLPVSVNGMGLREFSTVLLLAPMGVGQAEAVTLAVLLFAAQTAAGLLGFFPYLLGGVQRFDAKAAARENKEEEEPSCTAAA
jgi:uncharacterized membrane protein YbhN (UPF0104 family)